MINLVVLGIFSNIKAWSIGTIITGIIGFQCFKNWAKIVDVWAKFTERLFGKVEILSKNIKETASDVDDSIDDTTGKVSLDKKDEIIQDVKDVVNSAEDIVEEFKSKK